MNRIHPRLQGALPSWKNLEQVIGNSPPGSMRPKSAGCEGSGSCVSHLPSPLELEMGVYSQGTEGLWDRVMTMKPGLEMKV